MHISEGILSPEVLIGSALVSSLCVVYGLKKTSYQKIPKVAVLTSTFFVASLIHIPIGPSSVHLVLNGLLGIILGWSVFPALLIALFLQMLLFQFGGITTLGVNILTMGLPGLICFYLFKRTMRGRNYKLIVTSGFFIGFFGVLFSSILVAFFLYTSGKQFLTVSKLIILAHLPVMLIEGILTSLVCGFIFKIKPDLLKGVYE